MKIFLTDQRRNFHKHLGFLKSQPVMKYDKSGLVNNTSSIDLEVKSLDKVDLEFFFNYEIFPDNIMTFLTQWQSEGRKMRVGDTIVQQVYIPPTRILSQKILFGVRINRIIDETQRKGFSYETLEGHVERGESAFTIEQEQNNLKFVIHTFSAPGNPLTKLLGPVFSVPYQTFCTKAALRNVKARIEGPQVLRQKL